MLNISDTIERYGHQEDDVFIIDRAIAFDFSAKSPVTFLMFDGAGAPTPTPLARRLKFWTKFFQSRLGQRVNVMIIRDGQRDFGIYTANYAGIPGVCDDFFGIANLVRDKLYVRGTTRRAFAVADCAGAIPAILTSSLVPFDSMMLLTPYLRIFGSELEFDTSIYSMWIARARSIWVHDNLAQHRRFFDLTEFLEKFVQQPGSRLDLHWATTTYGTDLLFRHMVDHLRHRHNVTITDHAVPTEFDPHLLDAYLSKHTLEYYELCQNHVQEQFAALNIVTKLTKVDAASPSIMPV